VDVVVDVVVAHGPAALTTNLALPVVSIADT